MEVLKFLEYFVWKITILRQKIIFFPIAEGDAKIFWVFRVKNHDFTPKNHIFSNFRGGHAPGTPPPLDPPLHSLINVLKFFIIFLTIHCLYTGTYTNITQVNHVTMVKQGHLNVLITWKSYYVEYSIKSLLLISLIKRKYYG